MFIKFYFFKNISLCCTHTHTLYSSKKNIVLCVFLLSHHFFHMCFLFFFKKMYLNNQYTYIYCIYTSYIILLIYMQYIYMYIYIHIHTYVDIIVLFLPFCSFILSIHHYQQFLIHHLVYHFVIP